MAGTYSEPIVPTNNGAPGNYITYMAEGDVIINPTEDLPDYRSDTTINGITDDGKQCRGLYLLNIDYIRVKGFRFIRPGRWVRAYQADYNIIKDNEFSGATAGYARGIFLTESDYNVITGNTLEDPGSSGYGDSMVIEHSERNLIYNNTFLDAGHATFAIRCSNENVFRNNYVNNKGENKGGEIYQLCDGTGCLTQRNLIEGNIIRSEEDHEDPGAESSIQYAGQKGIIRRNLFYDNYAGFNWALYPGSDCPQPPYEAYHNYDNRMYHNVFYGNRHTGMILPDQAGAGKEFYDNIIKNNVLAGNTFEDEVQSGWDIEWWNTIDGNPIQLMFAGTDGFSFENNIVHSEPGEEDWAIVAGGRSPTQTPPNHDVGWWNQNSPLFTANQDIDPGFNNPLAYDFTLKDDSQMIDQGAFLTTAASAGSGTTIPVDDASYFYDGFGIPGEQGDIIQLEGETERLRITAIDYGNDEITLNQSTTWSDDQGVALAYEGTAPDIGAYEQGLELHDSPPPPACITDQQLLDYIADWKSGTVLMSDLVAVILAWKDC
jgi:parallel beta-helix repeat protein